MSVPLPQFVRFVKQTGFHGDCGVATLAMLTGVLYEDALAAAVSVQPSALQLGMTWHEMRQAAKLLGCRTRVTSKYDIDEATGILNVAKRPGRSEHFVFLWDGRVIDGNGEFWREPADYLKHHDYKPYALMVLVRTDGAKP